MEYLVNGLADTFTATVRKQAFKIALPADLPEQSIRKIFEYGLQRILNDSAASAKDGAEALELAGKRWDSLRAGVIRQSANRVGDPVAREAMKLAVKDVQANAKFKAWAQANGLKTTDKAFRDKVAELAKPLAEREDYVAKAEAIVAIMGDDVPDIELDI